MVRFPICPIVLFCILLTCVSSSVFSAVAPFEGGHSAIGKCYAWRVRHAPAAPGLQSQSEQSVETIFSSRCKVELPACKVVMEIVCRGAASKPSEASCVPCSKSKCSDVVPVCRFVSRAYRKGDCLESVDEPCQVAMRDCTDLSRLQSRFRDQIDKLCPQSSMGVDVRIRVEPATP